MATDTLIDELLVRGADDWVDAAEVAWLAKSVGKATTDEDVKKVSFDLIRAVLLAGLMEAGEVAGGGFFAWNISPTDSVNRIEHAWEILGRLPDIGEVCWLANTAAGNQRAQRSVARRV
ncbi:MAG TPA: hypothetical protein VKV80_07680 [Streptosporangiaceae bacterium]|nr:hypothetical protein [Streptosporangiaceae bacterium]